MRYPLSLIGLTLLLASCQSAAVQQPVAPDSPPQGAPEQATQSPTPESAQISTNLLTPETISIALSALPEPFDSDSASKSPNVIDRPANASLNVPEGFTVNIFAEGLQKPRWLALTPEGDVLVTETRENKIQKLTDADGDGIAEGKETFATASNGLDIPFGMAFSAESFFLGNTDEVLRFPFAAGQTALEGRGDRIATLPGGGYNQPLDRATSSPPQTATSSTSPSAPNPTSVKKPPPAPPFKP